jgi:hypothetical protein
VTFEESGKNGILVSIKGFLNIVYFNRSMGLLERPVKVTGQTPGAIAGWAGRLLAWSHRTGTVFAPEAVIHASGKF